jgi:hypothetical protein
LKTGYKNGDNDPINAVKELPALHGTYTPDKET